MAPDRVTTPSPRRAGDRALTAVSRCSGRDSVRPRVPVPAAVSRAFPADARSDRLSASRRSASTLNRAASAPDALVSPRLSCISGAVIRRPLPEEGPLEDAGAVPKRRSIPFASTCRLSSRSATSAPETVTEGMSSRGRVNCPGCGEAAGGGAGSAAGVAVESGSDRSTSIRGDSTATSRSQIVAASDGTAIAGEPERPLARTSSKRGLPRRKPPVEPISTFHPYFGAACSTARART